jgi:hypothetical protein
MNTQLSVLVPSSQVVFTVDMIRLVYDGADERDMKAAHFLHRADIHKCAFLVGKPGAAVSFSGDDVFLLVLAQQRKGQMREFRFMSGEDKPMNQIDDGDIFVTPESLDDDGMLVFEGRSKKHPMKWFFHCLTADKLAERKAKAAQPPPLNSKKLLLSREEPDEQEVAPASQFRGPVTLGPASSLLSAGSLQPPIPPVSTSDKVVDAPKRQPDVVQVGETSTKAVGPNAGSTAQLKERNGDSMATKKPRSLIEYLILAFCESLKADPDIFATGVRGSGDINSRVKEGVVFVARQLNVAWANISVGKGMPSASNAMTVFKRAEARYDTGKNEFGRMVDAVVKAIPEQFMPAEKSGESKDASSKVAAEKSGPRKTRGPYKPRGLQAEKPLKAGLAETKSPLVAVTLVGTAYVDMTIFVISQMEDFSPQKAAALAKAAKMTEEQLYAVIGRVGTLLKGQLENLPQMVGAAKVLIEALKK